MCIIAYVKSGKDVSDERIRYMFEKNPDGAGLMWKPTKDSEVEIRKGFMTVEELIKAYRRVPKSCERAIHMRIATAGKISVDCCHPFPVRKSVDLMRNAIDKTDVALMHNGIINYCQPKGGMSATYSDSMLFAATYLYHFKNLLGDEMLSILLEKSTPSRLLIMRKGQSTVMIGDWHEDENGIMYSNSGYKPAPYTYTSYGSYGTYDWGYNCGKSVSSSYKSSYSSAKAEPEETLSDWDYETEYDLDVSQYFEECLEDGMPIENIDVDIEDYIYESVLGMNCEGWVPELDSFQWLDAGKLLTVTGYGLPGDVKTFCGFDVVACRRFPLVTEK